MTSRNAHHRFPARRWAPPDQHPRLNSPHRTREETARKGRGCRQTEEWCWSVTLVRRCSKVDEHSSGDAGWEGRRRCGWLGWR